MNERHIYVKYEDWYFNHSEQMELSLKEVPRNDHKCPYCGAEKTTDADDVSFTWVASWAWSKYECGTECAITRGRITGKLLIAGETLRTAIYTSAAAEDII